MILPGEFEHTWTYTDAGNQTISRFCLFPGSSFYCIVSEEMFKNRQIKPSMVGSAQRPRRAY